jgi:GNAT superfamily N-acetyltransferase
MTISIRQATKSDWSVIGPFIDQAFGRQAPFKGIARWNWQFAENPFGQEAGDRVPVWIAIDAGKVVGQIAVQSGIVCIDNNEYPAGWMVDVMVLPEYRGQSLAHRLHREVASSVPFLTMLTMAPATRRMALRERCVTLGPVREFVKLVNLDNSTLRRYLLARFSHRPVVHPLVKIACSLYADRVFAGLLNGALGNQAPPDRLALCAAKIDIQEKRSPDGETEYFWNRVKTAYPAIFARNTQFLNWRFVNAPDLNYRCFVARRSGQCVGYIVLRRTTDTELSLGVIADLLTMPTDSEAIGSLLDHALLTFDKDPAVIDCVTSNPTTEMLLRQRGFFTLRTAHPTVVCRDASLRERVVELKDHWYFTKSDHDWDQINPT